MGSRAGLSLVELTMAALAMATLLGITSVVLQRTFKTESQAQSTQSFSTTLSAAFGVLQDTDLCTGAFVTAAGNKVAIGNWKLPDPGPVSVGELRVKGASSGSLLSTLPGRNFISKTTTVTSMILQNGRYDAAVSVGGVTLDRYYAQLRVHADQKLENTTTYLEQLLPVALFVDPTTSEIRTCGTTHDLSSAGFGNTIGPPITVIFRKTGPFGGLIFDSSTTNWAGGGADVRVADTSWKACFLTGVYIDPDTSSSQGIDAHSYQIDTRSDGVYLKFRGHILGNDTLAVGHAEFDIRCLQ